MSLLSCKLTRESCRSYESALALWVLSKEQTSFEVQRSAEEWVMSHMRPWCVCPVSDLSVMSQMWVMCDMCGWCLRAVSHLTVMSFAWAMCDMWVMSHMRRCRALDCKSTPWNREGQRERDRLCLLQKGRDLRCWIALYQTLHATSTAARTATHTATHIATHLLQKITDLWCRIALHETPHGKRTAACTAKHTATHCNTHCNTHFNTHLLYILIMLDCALWDTICNTYCNTHCNTYYNTYYNTHCNTHCNTQCYTQCYTHCYTHCNTHCNTRCSHCNTLQHAATHSKMGSAVLCNNVSHVHHVWYACVAVFVAMCCSVLQCHRDTAVMSDMCVLLQCVLPCVAVCCIGSVIQPSHLTWTFETWRTCWTWCKCQTCLRTTIHAHCITHCSHCNIVQRAAQHYMAACHAVQQSMGTTTRCFFPYTNRLCVLLCFIKPILGNRYGPGVNSLRQ